MLEKYTEIPQIHQIPQSISNISGQILEKLEILKKFLTRLTFLYKLKNYLDYNFQLIFEKHFGKYSSIPGSLSTLFSEKPL